MNPKQIKAYFQQAKALFALGRSEESVQSIKAAFALEPERKAEFMGAYPELAHDSKIRSLLGLDD